MKTTTTTMMMTTTTMMTTVAMMKMLRSVYLFGVCFLSLASVVSGTDCNRWGQTLKPGQYMLSGNCNLQMKCNPNGQFTAVVETFPYRCPARSRCVEFACACNPGYRLGTKDKFGMLRTCIDATQCTHNGKTYHNGAEWLRGDCKYRYKCVSGSVKGQGSHRCPSNSGCNGGKCKCRSGFSTSRVQNGFLERCRANSCRYGGNNYGYGAYWLSDNCRALYKCESGTISYKGSHSCPANSHCSGEKCMCDSNYRVQSLNWKMLLGKCEPIQCNYYGTMYGNGAHWLNNECTARYICDNGNRREFGHSCPANSRCTGGKCECHHGFMTETTRYNVLISCKTSSCQFTKNRAYPTGQQWLNNDCTTRHTCADGLTKSSNFQCPHNSECMYGRCECRESAHPEKKDNFGIVIGCAEPVCHDSHNTYKLNDIWLSGDCKKKYKCHAYGIREADTHRCPRYSTCDNANNYGVCKCDEGYEETSRDSAGFLLGCKSSSCTYNLIKKANGDEWFHKGSNCKIRIKCVDNKLDAGPSQCPANSSCKDDACQCDEDFVVAARDSVGFITSCEKYCKD